MNRPLGVASYLVCRHEPISQEHRFYCHLKLTENVFGYDSLDEERYQTHAAVSESINCITHNNTFYFYSAFLEPKDAYTPTVDMLSNHSQYSLPKGGVSYQKKTVNHIVIK